MKKLSRFLVLVLLCGMLVLLSGFLVLGMYYRNNFPVNTWINGVYCTGKTIEQVNRELVAQTGVSDVVITDGAGVEWRISAADLELCPDYTGALKAYMRKNATVLWMQNIQKPATVSLAPGQYSWNAEKLEEAFKAFGFVREEGSREKGCSIKYAEDIGYYLYDGNKARLNIAKTLDCIKTCLSGGELSVNLAGKGCYEDLEDTAEDAAKRVLWGQLQEYYDDCGIVYDMGAEQIPFTPAVLSSFLKADENGQLLLNEAGQLVIDGTRVEQWVDDLAERYNTCGTQREFQATRGDVVSVKYSTYGTELDTKAEKKYLLEALAGNGAEQEMHIPAYVQEGYARGLDDIGDTYIEVDMTEQHMYYYVDGELRLDTDVVTGNTSRRRGTPEGINFVYNKQKNRILRGADYATPVKYWMPVKGAVGIHDADWRREFGGEIYKKNGSHGCINTPPEVMAELYDMVEIGTPVIMFY
ncbi:MAG: L,D-transpeptidase/peptidoglycan binding protein [Butyrivibrio sp.]|nr:L,D-transpeptidase/peptidoglycan binding protein [Acetatifactor muris]MCM1560545.1 L,D-transpeptidase/peptidoglycan binding protein [Butyrivibrio sp.]